LGRFYADYAELSTLSCNAKGSYLWLGIQPPARVTYEAFKCARIDAGQPARWWIRSIVNANNDRATARIGECGDNSAEYARLHSGILELKIYSLGLAQEGFDLFGCRHGRETNRC
jgi:hypothetical protein